MPIPHRITDRFPYQFEGKNIGLSIARGWVDLFAKLCEDIDAVLGDTKRGFEWSQVKEKFGASRFYYRLNATTDKSIADQIETLVNAAEAKTMKMCLVCSLPAKGASYGGYYAVLCPDHAKQMLDKGHLPEMWTFDDLQSGEQK